MKNFVNGLLFSSIVGKKHCQENPWKMINWKKKKNEGDTCCQCIWNITSIQQLLTFLNIGEIRKDVMKASSGLSKQNFIPYHILPYHWGLKTVKGGGNKKE